MVPLYQALAAAVAAPCPEWGGMQLSTTTLRCAGLISCSQDLLLGSVEPGPISRSEKLCLKHLGTACARHGFCHRLGKAVLRNAEVAESCARHLPAAVKSSARAWQALQSNAGGWIGAVHRLPGLGLAIEARRGPVGGGGPARWHTWRLSRLWQAADQRLRPRFGTTWPCRAWTVTEAGKYSTIPSGKRRQTGSLDSMSRLAAQTEVLWAREARPLSARSSSQGGQRHTAGVPAWRL